MAELLGVRLAVLLGVPDWEGVGVRVVDPVVVPVEVAVAVAEADTVAALNEVEEPEAEDVLEAVAELDPEAVDELEAELVAEAVAEMVAPAEPEASALSVALGVAALDNEADAVEERLEVVEGVGVPELEFEIEGVMLGVREIEPDAEGGSTDAETVGVCDSDGVTLPVPDSEIVGVTELVGERELVGEFDGVPDDEGVGGEVNVPVALADAERVEIVEAVEMPELELVALEREEADAMPLLEEVQEPVAVAVAVLEEVSDSVDDGVVPFVLVEVPLHEGEPDIDNEGVGDAVGEGVGVGVGVGVGDTVVVGVGVGVAVPGGDTAIIEALPKQPQTRAGHDARRLLLAATETFGEGTLRQPHTGCELLEQLLCAGDRRKSGSSRSTQRSPGPLAASGERRTTRITSAPGVWPRAKLLTSTRHTSDSGPRARLPRLHNEGWSSETTAALRDLVPFEAHFSNQTYPQKTTLHHHHQNQRPGIVPRMSEGGATCSGSSSAPEAPSRGGGHGGGHGGGGRHGGDGGGGASTGFGSSYDSCDPCNSFEGGGGGGGGPAGPCMLPMRSCNELRDEIGCGLFGCLGILLFLGPLLIGIGQTSFNGPREGALSSYNAASAAWTGGGYSQFLGQSFVLVGPNGSSARLPLAPSTSADSYPDSAGASTPAQTVRYFARTAISAAFNSAAAQTLMPGGSAVQPATYFPLTSPVTCPSSGPCDSACAGTFIAPSSCTQYFRMTGVCLVVVPSTGALDLAGGPGCSPLGPLTGRGVVGAGANGLGMFAYTGSATQPDRNKSNAATFNVIVRSAADPFVAALRITGGSLNLGAASIAKNAPATAVGAVFLSISLLVCFGGRACVRSVTQPLKQYRERLRGANVVVRRGPSRRSSESSCWGLSRPAGARPE